jgi:hypothetical protein
MDGAVVVIADLADPWAQLRAVKSLDTLVRFLKDELDWPIGADDLEEVVFEYSPEEVGLDSRQAAAVREVRQLRPLVSGQPFGVFYVDFEPRKLPVVVLRRLLAGLVPKGRSSAQHPTHPVWSPDDLVFVAMSGEQTSRTVTFAQFQDENGRRVLRSFSWDQGETHFYYLRNLNLERLRWPLDAHDVTGWRASWQSAFPTPHHSTIHSSKDLATALADVAARTRASIRSLYEYEAQTGTFHRLHAAFRGALIEDLDVAKFADVVAQTVSYGLFSARATGSQIAGADHLGSLVPPTNPFLRELFDELTEVDNAGPSALDLDELGVNELAEVLNATDLESVLMDFGRQTGGGREDPVIHFYELFLSSYDPKEKVRRGVFYTPRPVVQFMVKSVDETLRRDFGLRDGLADVSTWAEVSARTGVAIPSEADGTDAFVVVLDPATGTGTFLVEAIDLIHRTMMQKWHGEGRGADEALALWNEYVPNHLLPRLYGFELLVAPYAIAHLKIGLKLRETGYTFGTDRRARVYLTNSLEPSSSLADSAAANLFEALAHEAAAVNGVKREERFTVVIGNPPYSLMSANLGPVQRRMVDPFRYVEGQKVKERGALQLEKNLQDDYVKFVRLAQMQTEAAGVGVVALITNHAYIDNPTLRGVRHALLSTYRDIFMLDLHGNSKRKEIRPGGGIDSNVFDIQQGVAIAILVRAPGDGAQQLRWGELWGPRDVKYEALRLGTQSTLASVEVRPRAPLFMFVPHDEALAVEFDAGVSIDDKVT